MREPLDVDRKKMPSSAVVKPIAVNSGERFSYTEMTLSNWARRVKGPASTRSTWREDMRILRVERLGAGRRFEFVFNT